MTSATTAETRALSSVFIGNIPLDLTEDQLKDLFSECGPVVNFKLFYDKTTGKSSGFAFCEYKEPELAVSATRNLGGYELKGNPLSVELATSEKCRQDLAKLQGTLVDSPAEATEGTPEKAPEEISKAVASLPAEQMFELMKQMKMCIENNPQEARNLLLQNPQLAYALLQAQVIMRIVDPEVAVKILDRGIGVPTTSVESETKPEQMSGTQSMANTPSTFNQEDSSSSISQIVLNPHSRPSTMMPRQVGPPNQFADQDFRTVADQDLRQLPPPAGDVRGLQVGADKQFQMPMGDQDFRTLGTPAAAPESRPFDPRFRNLPAAESRPSPSNFGRQGNVDPRTFSDPRNVTSSSRVEDPRKGGMSTVLNSRLSAAGSALQNLGPMMPPHPGMGGAPSMMPEDQEKAALIMQVLQLTEQQIAQLPPEQRSSIMVLKAQLAQSQLI